MRPRLIIVGAGLGGCTLADALADDWNVTMVELSAADVAHQERIVDVKRSAVTSPHVGYGLGGTTSIWHNGLIEIDSEVFAKYWPFQKSELKPYYAAAFPKLSGASLDAVTSAASTLSRFLAANGVPVDLMGQSLYYPRQRINVWRQFGIASRVSLVEGQVSGFIPDDTGGVRGVMVLRGNTTLRIEGDVVVLAAGGLGTPLLLQVLAQSFSTSALKHAGHHYEDHPTGFVAQITLDKPIYKFWNFSSAKLTGRLRLPVVVMQDGLRVSFQFRPVAQFRSRTKLTSMLNELRNEPYNLKNYFRLLFHVDDILDILSFSFGLKWPTKHYSLLMVAQQRADSSLCIWRDIDSNNISRKWELADAYIVSLEAAIKTVIGRLNCNTTAQIFPDWAADLKSSAHHSGTARMHASPDQGVCNSNAQVHGVANLFVCDGSLIPSSGHANTGLTIAALALRLANYLKHTYTDDSPASA